MIHSRVTGKILLGGRYAVLCDGPNSFHVTVQDGNFAIYEHITDISTVQDVIIKLRNELFPKLLRDKND